MPSRTFIELTPEDPDPDVRCDRGLQAVSASDRRLHAPDRSLLLLDGGSLVARLSCWWAATPEHEGEALGVIGHYAAVDADAGTEVLDHAGRLLARAGRTLAVGPMDGNTWRRYRFIVERRSEPPFALEPDNPDDWPSQWSAAGFTALATYASAINEHPGELDSRTDTALTRLADHGISIRPLDLSVADQELDRLYRLSLLAFRDNFLYTPIGRDEFIGQYQAVLPHVRPELVLLAEKGGELIGYMFALPDILQRMRGQHIDTVILKTLAVDPAARGLGLGGALLDLAQRTSHALGYRRAIHALFHEQNLSGRISGRYARPMRRYALFSRRLER